MLTKKSCGSTRRGTSANYGQAEPAMIKNRAESGLSLEIEIIVMECSPNKVVGARVGGRVPTAEIEMIVMERSQKKVVGTRVGGHVPTVQTVSSATPHPEYHQN